MNFSTRNRETIELYHSGAITRSMCCNRLYEINQRLTNASVLRGLDSPDGALFECIHRYLDDYKKEKAQFITFLYYKLRSMAQDIRRKDVLIRIPLAKAKTLHLEYTDLMDTIPDNNTRDIVGEIERWIETEECALSVRIMQEALQGKTRKVLERKYGAFGDLLEKALPFHELSSLEGRGILTKPTPKPRVIEKSENKREDEYIEFPNGLSVTRRYGEEYR